MGSAVGCWGLVPLARGAAPPTVIIGEKGNNQLEGGIGYAPGAAPCKLACDTAASSRGVKH